MELYLFVPRKFSRHGQGQLCLYTHLYKLFFITIRIWQEYFENINSQYMRFLSHYVLNNSNLRSCALGSFQRLYYYYYNHYRT
jgi:hypothetical protein